MDFWFAASSGSSNFAPRTGEGRLPLQNGRTRLQELSKLPRGETPAPRVPRIGSFVSCGGYRAACGHADPLLAVDLQDAFSGIHDDDGAAVGGDCEIVEFQVVKDGNPAVVVQADPNQIAGTVQGAALQQDAAAVMTEPEFPGPGSHANRLKRVGQIADLDCVSIHEVADFLAGGRYGELALKIRHARDLAHRLVHQVELNQFRSPRQAEAPA